MQSIVNRILRFLLEQSMYRDNNDAVYVTELVSCPMKYHLRRMYPVLGLQALFSEKVLLGRIVHAGLESIVSGIDSVRVEVPVETEINGVRIVGRADMVTDDTVIEIKTTRNGNNIPHENHILQASVYARLLEKPQATLLYIVMNNDIRILEYKVDPIDDGMLEKLVDGIIAKSPTPRFAWECNYCPFRAVCPARVSKQ